MRVPSFFDIYSFFSKVKWCVCNYNFLPLVRLIFFRVNCLLRAHCPSSFILFSTIKSIFVLRRGVKINYFDSEPLEIGQPLVSVVIPCFNYGVYVAEAIDSVLSQTLSNVEIIVVDGGSTDCVTLEILAKLSRPRTRVIFQSGQSYVGANRNYGILHATGRYICCLDADDRLDPTFFEKAVYQLETFKYDVVSAGYISFGKKVVTLCNMPHPVLEDLVLGNHVLTCAVFRHSFFKKTSGFVDTGAGSKHVAEDWRFWMELAITGARFYNIPESLLYYRIHDAPSLSRQKGVPAVWKQGQQIRSALASRLTPDAFRRSRAIAQQVWRCRVPGGVLNDSLFANAISSYKSDT
jgi:glycosyltransferase involved in cell wall biosynthesis